MKSICTDPSAYKSNDTILISLKCCSSPLPFKLIAPSRQRLLSFMDQPSGEPQGTAWNNRECVWNLPNFTYCLAGLWDLVNFNFFFNFFPPSLHAQQRFLSLDVFVSKGNFQFVIALSNSQDYWLSPAWASGRFWTLCFLAEEKTQA